ncbi:uncharacterized protein LOC110023058 isoform X2 [Phalaenopsis equestris]|uniref:uncharacterized protein LOC110023058 isoform X2 n=1 Tax=Phalaenopsis equestris TaxID=78828 RepID=UPI0009E39CCA|nr:uncharacterized protein LOC110023058 isoform X2 [Phalaenopsis equestris]
MPDLRHKREGADFDFVVRGSLDGCVSSCSSTRGGADLEDDDLVEDDAPDLVARRRRRSALEGDDIAESSAAARRHSRILSRWVARHAEEMITNIERRNRESELMALAGLHTVSTLDSSFLRESRRSPSIVEQPVAARASAILQMWRELEDMSGARERRSGAVGDRIRSERRGATESNDNGYRQWDRGSLGPSNGDDNIDDDADRSSSREQSPDLGDGERERVRQIVRGWMAEERMRESSAPDISPRNESPRSEWLGENERERVRLVREWVQMSSQQRDARASRREGPDPNHNRDGFAIDHHNGQAEHVRRAFLRIRGRQARLDVITRMARERQRELQGLSEARAVSGFAHRSRIQSLLRGRFLRNGSTEDGRSISVAARELGQLRQGHPVSGLRSQGIDVGQRNRQVDTISSPSISDSRSDQLHSTNAGEPSNYDHNQSESRTETETSENQVSDIPQLESNRPVDDMEWQESANQAEIWPEESLEHGRREWQQSTEGDLSEWHDEAEEESDSNWHENTDQDWFNRAPEDAADGHIPESDDWHDNDSQVTVENWLDEPSHPSRNQFDIPISRVNRFIQSDDENVYSMELRELLSRRSVSNLLHSGFRESLDRLIRSYVQRQGRAPLDWDLHRTSTPESPEDMDQQREDMDQQRDDRRDDREDNAVRPPVVIPSPPVPPRQPLWHSVLYRNSWNRRNMHRTDIEWDAINDIRAELVRLQQGMSNMQRMLEACMDMQLELQRSVRQEVSAALNRSQGGEGLCEDWAADGSKWTNVKNGTCCICCDVHIDSLLYRCGHMCTCSKCANELVRNGGKCPLCRAPIIEVIRAYSIL